MKRYFLKILSALTIILGISSCDKLPNNGDLDDMWQLMTVTDDGVVTNVKDRQVYWCIRMNLIMFNARGEEHKFAHFSRNGNTLEVYDLCHMSAQENEQDNDEWITDEDRNVIALWGIFPEKDPEREGRLKQTFTIELLNNNNMTLTSGKYKLTFRKF